jgi:hypothetical protein
MVPVGLLSNPVCQPYWAPHFMLVPRIHGVPMVCCHSPPPTRVEKTPVGLLSSAVIWPFPPPHFTLILRVHAVGAVCRHSFAMSEALKIQILFKGTCVKYCSARPKPVGCRHFFKYLFFGGKKMTSSLALQILLRYRAPKILIYCGFLFPPK